MVSAKLETTAEYCWELEVSIHNNTPLTAAATWLQLCTLWQLCCRECCTAYHLTSVTNGWEHCTAFINSGGRSTSTFHVIWWQLQQQQQHHSHHRDFLNLDVRTQRTATWRLETQSSDDSSHWSNTVTMSWPGWCPVTLVSTWILNSHTYNFEK